MFFRRRRAAKGFLVAYSDQLIDAMKWAKDDHRECWFWQKKAKAKALSELTKATRATSAYIANGSMSDFTRARLKEEWNVAEAYIKGFRVPLPPREMKVGGYDEAQGAMAMRAFMTGKAQFGTFTARKDGSVVVKVDGEIDMQRENDG